MTVSATTPPANLRQPLSLRELFCLTTLACLAVGLVFGPTWYECERWLFGSATFGALAGILLNRFRGGKSWPLAVALGIAAVSIGVICFPTTFVSHVVLDPQAAYPGSSWDPICAKVATAALGVILSLLVVASHLLLRWLTSPTGFFSAIQRLPWGTGTALATLGAIALFVVNLDFVLNPLAWAPKHVIVIRERSRVVGSGISTCWVTLSPDGRWLGVTFSQAHITATFEPLGPRTWVYDLAQRPQATEFAGLSPHESYHLAFSPSVDRIAFLDDHSPLRFQITSIASGRTRSIEVPPENLEALQQQTGGLDWLDGNHIGIDALSGSLANSYIVFDIRSGEIVRSVLDESVEIETRFRREYHYKTDRVCVYELGSQRLLQEFSLADPFDYGVLSPDGRYHLGFDHLYDLQTDTARAIESSAWGFTRPGQILSTQVLYASLWPRGWWDYLPIVGRVGEWLERERCVLIDPATGRIIAATRPLPLPIIAHALSDDGSTLALLTDEGVYIYDVPPEFR